MGVQTENALYVPEVKEGLGLFEGSGLKTEVKWSLQKASSARRPAQNMTEAQAHVGITHCFQPTIRPCERTRPGKDLSWMGQLRRPHSPLGFSHPPEPSAPDRLRQITV